jgi:hypothetical protein
MLEWMPVEHSCCAWSEPLELEEEGHHRETLSVHEEDEEEVSRRLEIANVHAEGEDELAAKQNLKARRSRRVTWTFLVALVEAEERRPWSVIVLWVQPMTCEHQERENWKVPR